MKLDEKKQAIVNLVTKIPSDKWSICKGGDKFIFETRARGHKIMLAASSAPYLLIDDEVFLRDHKEVRELFDNMVKHFTPMIGVREIRLVDDILNDLQHGK